MAALESANLILTSASESQSESLERMEHFATVIKPATEEPALRPA